MPNVLITGCTGFIGSHLAEYFLKAGSMVIGIDNLSRKGTNINLKALSEEKKFKFYKEDIRDFEKIVDIFKEQGPFDLIIHEAAQVAVTMSVIDPREDLEINTFGTFNLLESTRLHSPDAFFMFASTNKVYGKMDYIKISQNKTRYEYADARQGVNEESPLNFYSPYGCSKGAADQYVRDYSRIYGLKTVVLRQSCIYGTRQFGIEDQGWVAWFIIGSLLGKPLTIYGDGRQLRDILWVEDLVGIYVKLFEHAAQITGEVFNIGGGPKNTLSLLELVDMLKRDGILKRDPAFSTWRSGDQKIFVCDINKVRDVCGWEPTISPNKGFKKLIEWAIQNKTIIETLFTL